LTGGVHSLELYENLFTNFGLINAAVPKYLFKEEMSFAKGFVEESGAGCTPDDLRALLAGM
jgi:hypothetical protein